MSVAEVKEFRRRMRRCVSKDFTPAEEKEIQQRIERINKIGERIVSSNGGRNPILGY